MSTLDPGDRWKELSFVEFDVLDIITQAELAAAMRHDFVPEEADRYAAMVFQARAEHGGPVRLVGHTLGYVMMVSPELEARVRAYLGQRGIGAADLTAYLEETRAFVASLNGQRLSLDEASAADSE